MTQFAYFEGAIVPVDQAKIGITNNTFHYGTGCFAGIRGYWNDEQQQLYIFRIHDHFRRFLNSARMLLCRLDDTPAQLADVAVALMQKEGWQQNCYIRPVAYKDDSFFRVWLHDAEDRIAIVSIPVDTYLKTDGGAKVCISSWRRVDDTAIPARGKINGSYVNSALVKSDAMLSGFDEALVLNQDGHVSEASAANFMMVRDGVLITPPITDNILEGITRRSVLELARNELHLDVVERPIDRTELYIADEAFFCGTGVQITPIASVDHRPMAHGVPGPITQRVTDLFMDVVYGRHPGYMHWLTPVYGGGATSTAPQPAAGHAT